MLRVLLVLTLTALAPATALAGQCDSFARKADTAKGEALVQAFKGMLSCDSKEAQASFQQFTRSAGDTDTLVGLSLVAIDAQAYTPVWGVLEKLDDYNQRADIAKRIGAACGEHPEVATFLKGAYFGLRGIQFGQWDGALQTCESESLAEWLTQVAAKPPATSYDEKYNTILASLVSRRKAEALPVLQRAAIDAAANEGPFNAIIEKMDDAVQPDELGADITPENRKRLEDALLSVANAVVPEKAAMVADRLYNAGAEQSAASLLPRIYPDRVQANGGLLYGAASIEHCDGEALIHYAAVNEPATRWAVRADLEEPTRAFKPRLKCATEGPWPVLATSEPVASESDIDTWVDTLVVKWTEKGNAVKTRKEKPIALP